MKEWTNVYDDLPEHEGDVLVVCQGFGSREQVILIDRHLGDGTGWDLYDVQVTHWMPLPEPPSVGRPGEAAASPSVAENAGHVSDGGSVTGNGEDNE